MTNSAPGCAPKLRQALDSPIPSIRTPFTRHGEVESIVQPDPVAGKVDMSITGLVKESRALGTKLEMRRTISSTLGEPVIRIRDVVTNRANVTVPHMLLYHCNFGYPFVDAGTDILWRGTLHSRGLGMDAEVFNAKHNFRKCMGPEKIHCGAREACAFIDVTPDSKGMCTVGLYNKKLSLALAMRYKKKQLPWVTNWQHCGPGEYVTAVEPGTNQTTGRAAARAQKNLIQLRPGQSRTYELELSVLTEQAAITRFVKAAGPK